ncbi:hypothetical protein [Rhizobium sp. LCM 4573]|uniref:hypothetical protein n=1 Tax=Rhizobium sp. LCM 4573 TaxID=1848291 RepID=UPI0008D9020D|nr:hypothetical protein [Rhizobium sp. LCM 4573]OHV81652.1 hypothetical protein LCM4573_21465 [Rhizobium sp. LCM 4573]
MQTHCTIRAFDGCSCAPGECRSVAIDLGRFTKTRDMRGVFTPTIADYLIVIALFLAVVGIGLTINELRDMDRRHEIAGRV